MLCNNFTAAVPACHKFFWVFFAKNVQNVSKTVQFIHLIYVTHFRKLKKKLYYFLLIIIIIKNIFSIVVKGVFKGRSYCYSEDHIAIATTFYKDHIFDISLQNLCLIAILLCTIKH